MINISLKIANILIDFSLNRLFNFQLSIFNYQL